MREKVLSFGERRSLVGVVSEPAAAARLPGAPAVILLNSGILHRVGPNRSYVRIARALTEAGITAVRFDLSGLGDSGSRTGQVSFVSAAVDDTRQCMDLLQSTRGASSFVLAGMCSGADNALRVAHHDPRVVGAGLIEAYTVPARGQLVHSYRRKLLSPRSWLRLLSGRSELWSVLEERRRSRRRERRGPPAPRQESLVPSPQELLAQLGALQERGTALCLIYASGSAAHYNYLNLVRPRLQASGRTRVEVITATDHVFTPLAAQRRLVEILREWVVDVARRREETPAPSREAAPAVPVTS